MGYWHFSIFTHFVSDFWFQSNTLTSSFFAWRISSLDCHLLPQKWKSLKNDRSICYLTSWLKPKIFNEHRLRILIRFYVFLFPTEAKLDFWTSIDLCPTGYISISIKNKAKSTCMFNHVIFGSRIWGSVIWNLGFVLPLNPICFLNVILFLHNF